MGGYEPDLATAMNDPSNRWAEAERRDECLAVHEEVYATLRRVLGDEHRHAQLGEQPGRGAVRGR